MDDTTTEGMVEVRVKKMDSAMKKMMERLSKSISFDAFFACFVNAGMESTQERRDMLRGVYGNYISGLARATLEEYDSIKEEYNVDRAIEKVVGYHQKMEARSGEPGEESAKMDLDAEEVEKMVEKAGRLVFQRNIRNMAELSSMYDAHIESNISQTKRRKREIEDLLRKIEAESENLERIYVDGYGDKFLEQLGTSLDKQRRKFNAMISTDG